MEGDDQNYGCRPEKRFQERDKNWQDLPKNGCQASLEITDFCFFVVE